MKKHRNFLLRVLCCALAAFPAELKAQDPITEIIREAITKVIKAADLQIQRLQNETIWLQNAQKTVENTLSRLKLEEIAQWTEKQKEQYREYYEELARVKAVISYYQRIRDITQKQVALVQTYQRTWKRIRQDPRFTTTEREYMAQVYEGILEESLRNLEQVHLVIRSFTTLMSDAKRLELINDAADEVEASYEDLLRFNRQNILLSLQRARHAADVESIKKLYGLP